jgi:hypothetical protein
MIESLITHDTCIGIGFILFGIIFMMLGTILKQRRISKQGSKDE